MIVEPPPPPEPPRALCVSKDCEGRLMAWRYGDCSDVVIGRRSFSAFVLAALAMGLRRQDFDLWELDFCLPKDDTRARLETALAE